MELLNILIGLTLNQMLHYAAISVGLYTIYYMTVKFLAFKVDGSEYSAKKAVTYNKKHERHSTEWTNQLAKDTQKENEYLVKTGIPEQNKRCGI